MSVRVATVTQYTGGFPRLAELACRNGPPPCNKRVLIACDRLLSDLSNPPSLDELVRSIGTNRNTLTKEFNSVFGMSAYSWLREQRLLQANRLLRETNWPIGKVGNAVGYSDPNHFSTSYKRRFGLSPRQHRREGGVDLAS